MRLLVGALEKRIDDQQMLGYLNLDKKATGAAEWKNLKEKLLEMRALKLRRVDLRACLVGKDPDVMFYLTQIFNCDVCCAPKAYDAYGLMTLGTPSTEAVHWDRWSQVNKGAIVQTYPGGRFAVNLAIKGESIDIQAMADSTKAAAGWVARNLPPGGTYKEGDPIYYHGLTPDKKAFVFAGDPRYRDYLVEWTRDMPLPKVDPMKAPIQ
jgi:hypothetical protein